MSANSPALVPEPLEGEFIDPRSKLPEPIGDGSDTDAMIRGYCTGYARGFREGAAATLKRARMCVPAGIAEEYDQGFQDGFDTAAELLRRGG